MKRFLLSIGILLFLPQIASAGLYDRVMDSVRTEQAINRGIDEAIVQFIIALYRTEDFEMTSTEVNAMVQGYGHPECSKRDEMSRADCLVLIERVERVARQEQRIRSLGNTLQASATSYELPISDLPGRTLQLSTDLRGILNIWSAGTGSITSTISGALIRTVSADPDVFRGPLIDIGERMETMSIEDRTAAVWRYQYGVRLIRGDREPRFKKPTPECNSEKGTERQNLWKCWPEVEDALLQVWEAAKEYVNDPDTLVERLDEGETAYFVFPKELFAQTLPDNVIVWVRIDRDDAGIHPFGDVGLQWETPLAPVQPALLTETGGAILGGAYPPEPVDRSTSEAVPLDGQGLCTSPVALRGYLCRPFVLSSPDDRCPQEGLAAPDEIRLTHCVHTGSLRFTAAGADACREIRWQDNAPFDANTQCTVTLRCAQRCVPNANASAVTQPKNAQGVIPICIDEQPEFAATYLAYHELVHAYQRCNEPIGFDPMAGKTQEERGAICCRREGEAYRAQCDMMERDGVFDGIDPVDGIPFNAETCAEAWTDFACGTQQGFNGCYTSRTYTPPFMQAMQEASGNNPKNLPDTCSTAIHPATMDPRVKALKESAERRDDVCTPGNQTTYKNRIGNNLCFVGQCVEQSTELHRMTAGRAPGTVGDEESPWNSPVTGTPLGNILMNPPLSQTRLPSYRPALLVREAEKALCQAQGLPPYTPPILCMIGSNRQLQLPSMLAYETAAGLVRQQEQQQEILDDLLELSPALGTRVGTDLYARYLREANRSFAGILSMAVQLFQEIRSVDFPTEMCPVGPGLPAPAQ